MRGFACLAKRQHYTPSHKIVKQNPRRSRESDKGAAAGRCGWEYEILRFKRGIEHQKIVQLVLPNAV